MSKSLFQNKAVSPWVIIAKMQQFLRERINKINRVLPLRTKKYVRLNLSIQLNSSSHIVANISCCLQWFHFLNEIISVPDWNTVVSIFGRQPGICPQILTWANSLLGLLWVSEAKMTVFSKKMFANEVRPRQVGEPILTTPHCFRDMGTLCMMASRNQFENDFTAMLHSDPRCPNSIMIRCILDWWVLVTQTYWHHGLVILILTSVLDQELLVTSTGAPRQMTVARFADLKCPWIIKIIFR